MLSNNLIKVSAAGAGKTWGICHDALMNVEQFDVNKKVLIVSYTNRGVEAIETELRKQNMGVLHPQISVMSWYKFLMSELIKPFQTYIFDINEIKGYDFSKMYGYKNLMHLGIRERYITGNQNILANEAAELVLQLEQRSSRQVLGRLEKTYQYIYIDEIQDMAGYDLNLIKIIMESEIKVVCVGDNKQATFKTNNSNKNKAKSGSKIWNFFSDLESNGIANIEQNQVSRRFNTEICNFANSVYPNENDMTTLMNEVTEHDGVFLICRTNVAKYCKSFSPTVLRYDVKTDTDGFPAFNFGECKGLTFRRVLIYPNKVFTDFLLKGKRLTSPEKYYVAVTRPKYSLTFVVEKLPVGEKFEKVSIAIRDTYIDAVKYIV